MNAKSNHLTFLLEGLPAKLSVLQESGKVSATIEVNSLSYTVALLTPLIETGQGKVLPPVSTSGRMSPECSAINQTPSVASSQPSPTALTQELTPLPHPPENGQPLDLSTENTGELPTGSWTRNTGESHRDAGGCSLYQALEPEESIPEKYYMTTKHQLTTLSEKAIGRGSVLLRRHAELVEMQTAEALQLYLNEGGDPLRIEKKSGGRVSPMVGHVE